MAANKTEYYTTSPLLDTRENKSLDCNTIPFFTLTQYVSVAIQKPFNDFVELCFSSIGLTLALSALCGQIASVTNKEDKFHTVLTYAGEKFLHSSLLLTQTSVLMFVKDYLVNSGSISVTIKKSVSLLSNGTAGLCAAQAALLWHWGFSALNSALWSRP
jgi:hypothetical protein